MQARLDEVDQLRKKQVERARYEADLAQRRYVHVDPANRLVADSLEADWNNKLRALKAAQEQYEQQRRNDQAAITEQQRERILALAHDFPQLWRNPQTPDRERKRLVRLLLEDVTLIQKEEITAHVRFKGGITKTLTLPRPLNSWEAKTTPAEVVNEIDRLLDRHTELEIAGILNERSVRSGDGKAFNSRAVARVRTKYQLKSRYDRLREKGMLTLKEMSDRLQLTPICMRAWRDHGLLKAYPVSDRNIWLYEDPGPDPPRKAQGIKLSERRRFPEHIARFARGAV
jgi:hypothetical protein